MFPRFAPSWRALVCSLSLLLAASSSTPTRAQVKAKSRARGAQRVALRHRFTAGHSALKIPFELVDNLIYVRTRVNRSEPLWFILDTGGDGVMVISTPFVKRHRLDELIPNRRMSNSGGAGGKVGASDGRVAGVRLGKFTLARPLVTLIQARAGEYATEKFDGVIGGEFFRRFKLIVDYTRRRVILEPNAHLGEPVEVDMSGLELAADGEDFKQYVVNEVLAHSPAAEAGMQGEDVLAAIDGRPTSELTLEQVRALLRRAGEERALSVRRGEQVLTFRLKLRRLI